MHRADIENRLCAIALFQVKDATCSGTLSETSLRNEVLYCKDDESYQHSAAQPATLETQGGGLRAPRHSIACVSLQLFQHCTIIFDSKMHLCTQKD